MRRCCNTNELEGHWKLESRMLMKVARPVCAVRRYEISLSQTGETREMFLSYQLTQ
jgi:hypothetical protein